MRTQAPRPLPTGLQGQSAAASHWYQPSRYLTRRTAAIAATVALIVVMAVARLWHVYAGPITVRLAPLRKNVPEQVFGPGTAAGGTLPRAVTVPLRAVTGLANNRGTVWTLEAGYLERRTVSFGPALLDGTLPVLAGLPAGASVVVGPTGGLRVGRPAVAAKGAGR